jgi:hypothetical protein
MSIRVCTYESLLENPEGGSKIEPLKIPPFTDLVCTNGCGRRFKPPRVTVDGMTTCPHCGWEDQV